MVASRAKSCAAAAVEPRHADAKPSSPVAQSAVQGALDRAGAQEAAHAALARPKAAAAGPSAEESDACAEAQAGERASAEGGGGAQRMTSSKGARMAVGEEMASGSAERDGRDLRAEALLRRLSLL